MTRPVQAFLNDVTDFLDREVILSAEGTRSVIHDGHRCFENCVVRVDDQEAVVKLKKLSFIRNAGDGRLERVNDVLSKSEIRIEFHFIDSESLTERWGTFLNQINLILVVPDVDLPAVLKWEASRDGHGDLKQDERIPLADGEYIAQQVTPRDAILTGVHELLLSGIQQFQSRSTAEEIPAIEYKVMYEDIHSILDQLEPVGD